jgi:hypothetical protein
MYNIEYYMLLAGGRSRAGMVVAHTLIKGLGDKMPRCKAMEND